MIKVCEKNNNPLKLTPLINKYLILSSCCHRTHGDLLLQIKNQGSLLIFFFRMNINYFSIEENIISQISENNNSQNEENFFLRLKKCLLA